LGKATLKLTRHALAHVEEAVSRSPVVRLDRGSVELDVQPLPIGQELRVCTHLTCVRVIGTHFSVQHGRPEQSDVVSVEHGLVAVSPADMPDIEVILGAGETFTSPWHNAPNDTALGSDDESDPVTKAPTPVSESRPEAWMKRAESYLQTGQTSAALAVFDELQRRFPIHPLAAEAAYAAATTAFDDGREREGLRRMKHYVERFPHGTFIADALWRLGTTAMKAKQNDQACAWLERLLTVSTVSARRAEAAFLLAGLREVSDSALAIRLYQRVLSEDAPQDIKAKAKARIEALDER
jgi:tetratricopeptide (TPR) repeat protein